MLTVIVNGPFFQAVNPTNLIKCISSSSSRNYLFYFTICDAVASRVDCTFDICRNWWKVFYFILYIFHNILII